MIARSTSPGTLVDIFLVFLRLGLTSFGGPVAHLGYFRTEFVDRRRWFDERNYADLVALCQFLPGPASSQVGIAIGLSRGGWVGSLAAWAGFTLPSAVLLVLFALGLSHWPAASDSGWLQGLKVAAVAVVAQAVWAMARNLCPDRPRAGIAIVAAVLMWLLPLPFMQLGVIALGAVVGATLLRLPAQGALDMPTFGVSRRAGALALAAFVAGLALLPVLATGLDSPVLGTIDAFYRAGSLVFGGGHVVLPLLQAEVVPGGAVDQATFLAGYGAAQAVPGPLFTFAAFLGAALDPAVAGVTGWLGAVVCLLAIFLPAWLLVVGALPFWDALRQRPGVQSTLAGINAAVVGILLAALYDPVWTSAIEGPRDVALGLACFGLLVVARVSPLWVVVFAAAGGAALAV
ncbi:chromate efflux transporter [Hydrogenophaga sp. XSHU_21]